MKKHLLGLVFIPLVLCLLLCLFLFPQGCNNFINGRGDKLLSEAQKLEKAGNYLQAMENYQLALSQFKTNNETDKARVCRDRSFTLQKIMFSYPYTREEAKKDLLKKVPGLIPDRAEEWLDSGKLDHIWIKGEPYFFSGIANTLLHQELDLLHQNPEAMKAYRNYAANILKVIGQKKEIKSYQPYINPITYAGNSTLNIPRKKLPKEGVFKLWIPLPLLGGPQNNCRVIFASPENAVKLPVQLTNDPAQIYLEIPFKTLKSNLKVQVKFTFTHYEQCFFSLISLDKVGTYDKNSELYKTFTASTRNIKLSPSLVKKARQIVGEETNPFLMARKIYDQVVDGTTYSHMPHAALDALNYAESEYVLEHGYGDCGAQSMYFAALCRAAGIPARTPGGWQMIGGIAGAHFWAEFYLPNYGWLPVDTSVAQIYKYLPEFSADQKQKIKDYYFGNMDPYRFTIQNDLDLPLTPPTDEIQLLSTVLQSPAAECGALDELPGALAAENWKLEVKASTEKR